LHVWRNVFVGIVPVDFDYSTIGHEAPLLPAA
jgi:hypothetical protein